MELFKTTYDYSVSLKIQYILLIYYRPQTKLRKGNVFTPVCQSFCSRGGVCLSACWDAPPPGQSPPGQTPPWAYYLLGRHPTLLKFKLPARAFGFESLFTVGLGGVDLPFLFLSSLVAGLRFMFSSGAVME